MFESDKKGAAHLGWYWVYHSPLDRLVVMDYQSTRGAVDTKDMQGRFKGYLQTDGYGVYKKIRQRTDVTPLLAGHMPGESLNELWIMIRSGQLKPYLLFSEDRKAKDGQLDAGQSKQIRLDESLLILN